MKNLSKCTTENLLNSVNHEKYYKPIGIHLSRQTNMSIPKKEKCRKIKRRWWCRKNFIAQKQQKAILNVYLCSLTVTEQYK